MSVTPPQPSNQRELEVVTRGMQEFLETFAPSVARIAERIRAGDSTALEMIPTMANSLQEVAHFLETLAMMNAGKDDPYTRLSKKLLTAGKLANDGLASRDLSLVADTLEFEICGGLDSLRELISPK